MKPNFLLLSLLVLPLAACDQGDTDLGELETESSGASESATSGGSESATSGGSESATSGGSESATSGGSESATSGPATSGSASDSATDSDSDSDTDASGSSGGGLYPAACEAAGWVESYEAWQAAAVSGNYSYVADDTTFVGKGEFQCQYHTTVTVEGGVVVQRELALIEQAEGADCEEDFVESGDEIGSGEFAGLHPAITMDEVYLTCCENQLDLPAEDWTTTFEVDAAGLFAHCSAFMTGCADGCNQGGAGEASIIEHSFGDQ